MSDGDESAAKAATGLGGLVKDLEEQLDRVLQTSDALKRDLDAERQKRLALERELDSVTQRLQRNEEEVAAKENQLAEMEQLEGERLRLASRLHEVEKQLADAHAAAERDRQLIERLKRTRSEAAEEVQSVEAQFERAIGLVEDLQARVALLSEERDALEGQLGVVGEKLHQVERERDLLRAEVDESRAALDEIRKALVDAVVTPSGGGSPAHEGRR